MYTAKKEQQKPLSTINKGKSALAEHVCDTKHKIAWENSKVISTNKRYDQRRCLETWHLNMSNHALNKEDGAYLSEEYTFILLADDVMPWELKKPTVIGTLYYP